MISIYFFVRSEGSTVFVREEVVETIREKNKRIQKSGAVPGQWLDLPGGKAQVAWLQK